MKRTRRDAVKLLAGALPALAIGSRLGAAAPCPLPADIDAATAPVLALLPEGALRAGLAGADPARCDDASPDGEKALAIAVGAALAKLPEGCPGSARLLLARAAASRAANYGRNDPLAAVHRPYRVSAYAGPHLDTPEALALYQPLDTPAAVEAWLAKLDHLADALLATGQGLRADEGAGCLPTVATGRAALAAMDGFTLAPAATHPLVAALRARIGDPAAADAATTRAIATLTKRVQPAMASLRDTMATLTRKGRTEPGIWALPQGDLLYAANFARAGDTDRTPADATLYARDEAKRIAALLDKRLALRGYKTGTIAERIAEAFSGRPGLVASDDGEGRGTLDEAARSRIEAAHVGLGKIVPASLATVAPPRIVSLPDMGLGARPGSFYLGAAAGRPATVWLDDRSVYALPVPGVSPIAYHLGLPGQHLLAEAGRTTPRAAIVAAARWPAMTEGWGCYAERLAADEGLFARDPWGDIARLSDELMRAARLVVDVGLHAERWSRVQAEQAMIEMTGAAQGGAIDRIIAMPGEAASYTLGLAKILELRDAAARGGGKHPDLRGFHERLLSGGPRAFGEVT